MWIDSAGLHLGPLYLRFYGLILMLGAMAGTALAAREARRRRINEALVWDGLIWALVGGIVGARLYHVLTPSPSLVATGLTTAAYFADPIKILEIWNGGLGIPGAIVGGLLGLWLYTRRHRVPLAGLVDVAAPGLSLGQAIGRWGNFFNQELYGRPTNLPWAIYIAPEHRVPGYTQFAYFHPTFLYESLLNLLVCGLLLWIPRRWPERLRPGDEFLLYLILYSSVRFGMELLRLDSSGWFDINVNQSLAVIVGLAAGLTLAWRQRRRATVALEPIQLPEDQKR